MKHCFKDAGGNYIPTPVKFAPCTDLAKRLAGSGNVRLGNLTYKFTHDAMVYATYSKGFRPGGVNRTAQAGVPPYAADFLKNYEIGWQTPLVDHHPRWNGALIRAGWA